MPNSSQPLDIQVLEQAIGWAADEPVWLCTVLHTWGSSPRSPGSLLAARADGHHCGSLSGGCIEEHFLKQIGNGRWEQPSQVIRYGDGELAPDVRLPCGGILDILVEYLPAGAKTQAYLRQQLEAIQGYQAVEKRVIPPAACHHLAPSDYSGKTNVSHDNNEIVIRLAAAPCLLVAGYSPVAHYCIEFAYSLGFEVILCEPRPEQQEIVSANRPNGARIEHTFPARFLEQHGCHANTAIVSLTHDPRLDDLTMMEAVRTPAFYIGVMGSERNSAKRRHRLEQLAGMTDEQLSRIHAPIGLNIGSKTPAEIALAIMADVVRVKNCGTEPRQVTQPTLDALEGVAENAEACAI